jgi:arginase family enzyme
VVAHIIGRGAPELVRFWGEPPLVREPDITLFGIDRVDPPEQEVLNKSPLRHILAVDIQAKGATASAKDALAHLHADTREFVLHVDLDVVDSAEFPAVNVPGSGGLRIDEFRAALVEFVRHKNLLGFDIAQFNPEKDPDGSGARKVVDLLVEALAARLAPESVSEEPASQGEPPAKTAAAQENAAEASPSASLLSEAGATSESPEDAHRATENALGAGSES